MPRFHLRKLGAASDLRFPLKHSFLFVFIRD